MATEKPKRKVFEGQVELVAAKRGFYGNRLIERGQKFMFAGGKQPSWAVEIDEPLPPEPKLLNGDIKPADARAAVAKKARGGTAEME